MIYYVGDNIRSQHETGGVAEKDGTTPTQTII